jgi:hypothetical protein
VIDSCLLKDKAARAANVVYLLVLFGIIFSTASSFRASLLHDEFFVTVKGGVATVQAYIDAYVTGKIASSDVSHKPYDINVQRDWTNRVIAPLHVDHVMIDEELPIIYVLMTPFSMLPLEASFYAWTFCSVIFVVIGLTLILYFQRRWDINLTTIYLLGVFASLPALINLRYGQFAFYLLGAASCFYYFWRKKRDIPAAFFLALSSLKPNLAIFLALPAVAQRRYKLLLCAAGVELMMLFITGMMIGWQAVIDYSKTILSIETTSENMGVFPEKMVSLRAVFSSFLSRQDALTASIATYFVAAAVLLYLWWKCKKDQEQKQDWLFALAVVALLVFSPHIHIYDCTLLALAAAVTLKSPNPFASLNGNGSEQQLWCRTLCFYPLLSWIVYGASFSFANRANIVILCLNLALMMTALAVVARASKMQNSN